MNDSLYREQLLDIYKEQKHWKSSLNEVIKELMIMKQGGSS